MLPRLLTSLMGQNGVQQALMIDDRGRLLAGINKQGSVPAVERTVNIAAGALEAVQNLEFGELEEVWLEGKARTMVDIITPHRILMLHGEGGNLARWRHSIDLHRRSLATTPEM
ncbi:MAG: hypothetical protein L7S56_07705 [Candidatus Poseidonia sp.]|nr:hypothetical protein [Poseidonia sp.]